MSECAGRCCRALFPLCWCMDCGRFAKRGPSAAMERGAGDSEEGGPRMAGFLEKKGKSRLVSLWHRYWFILEGQRLAYYETQPPSSMELPPPCKGSFALSPTTSVTASSSSRYSTGLYGSHHLNYHEIYIFTPSQLVTLRTKDFDEHRLWMQALLGCVKGQTKGQASSKKCLRSTSTTPLQHSTIHFRYSLTNLTTIEEKNNAWPMKTSHTMDNRNPNISQVKSGSAGDIIDKYAITDRSPSVMDEETLSEDEGVEETFDRSSLIRSDEDGDLPQSPEYCSPEVDKKKHQLLSNECLKEVNSPIVNVSEDIGSRLIRPEKTEKNAGLNKVAQSSEAKPSQAQESKGKSKKFFGMRESKRHNVPTSCQKVFKKCKESEMSHKYPQPMHKINEKRKSKSDQDIKKVANDDSVFEECKVVQEGSEFVNELKISSSEHVHPIQTSRSLSESMTENEEIKSPKKIKKKKGKSKKDCKVDVVHLSAIEIQSDGKSKLSKDSEGFEEGERKRKKKKRGFFSKMLKGKKSEFQEDRSEMGEEKQNISDDSCDALENPTSPGIDLWNENVHVSSLEERKPNVIAPKLHFGLKVIPADDAELKRKLQSRMMRIEADQNSSGEKIISANINRKLPVPLPRVKNETIHKLSIPVSVVVHDASSGKDTPSSPRPSLPPRFLSRPPPPSPPHDKPSNNSLVVAFTNPIDGNISKNNDATENFMSFEFAKKSRSSEAKARSVYDQVKIMGNKSGNIFGKSAAIPPYMMAIESPVVVIEEESAPQSAVTDMISEFKTVLPEGDDGKVSIHSEGGNDIRVNPGVEYDDIQYSTHKASLDSWELTGNGKQDGSVARHESPNDFGSGHAVETVCLYSLKETSDNAVQKVDELGLLLSELDRINSSPLQNTESRAYQRPVSEEVKRVSFVEEDFIAAYPIRRRRNSDPDYDIPRPHRLPRHHETNLDSETGANPSTGNQYDYENKSRQGADSIVIEATCFLGPGMDYSFDENRYFGVSEKNDSWSETNDEIQVMNYMGSLSVRDDDAKRDKLNKDSEFLSGNSSVYLDDYYDTNTSDKTNKYLHRTEEDFQETTQNTEENVLLRVGKIDRLCRSEKSREVYESDLDRFLEMNESLEGPSISRTLSKEELKNTPNPENECLLPLIVTDDEVNEKDLINDFEKESKKEGYTSVEAEYEVGDQGSMTLSEEIADYMKNMNQMKEDTFDASSKSSLKKRDLYEDHGDFRADEHEVILRQTYRSEDDDSARREHRTLRLSFATTETLIVEEEVLVATLKTTTTTTTTLQSSADDAMRTDNIENQKKEELVDEVVLDMERISDDHFGSMQIQSCIQT